LVIKYHYGIFLSRYFPLFFPYFTAKISNLKIRTALLRANNAPLSPKITLFSCRLIMKNIAEVIDNRGSRYYTLQEA